MAPLGSLVAWDERLAKTLRSLGVKEGAVVYTATDLTRLPLIQFEREVLRRQSAAERQHVWLDWVYESIFAVTGERGTLVVPTFSYDYARRNTPFVYEESASEVCNFSEYVRRKPGAVRSLHPLFSLAAIGPQARRICEDVGRSAYGAVSPFARLHELDAIFVFLGATLGDALTYAHHLEQLYGVNHAFHKVLEAPVFKDGKQVPGPWFAFVRYLGAGIDIELHPFEQRLKEKHLLRFVTTERGEIQAIACRDVHDEGLVCLAEDSCAFLKKPVRVHFKQDNLKVYDRQTAARLVGWLDEDVSKHVSD